jgi:hypothetical protein
MGVALKAENDGERLSPKASRVNNKGFIFFN